MSNWRVDDHAIFISDAASRDKAGVSGATVVLLKFVGQYQQTQNAWHVRLVDWLSSTGGTTCYVDELYLHRPYDPLEPGSWEDIKDIFTPKELEVIA